MTEAVNAPNRPLNQAKYGKLLAQVLPAPIESEAEYERMLAEIEKIIDKGLRLGEDRVSPEENRLLDLMTTLVEVYEQRHFHCDPAPPAAVLRLLLADRGLRQRDLKPILGSSGVISEIVNGKRLPSKAQAKALGAFFRVSPDLFVASLEIQAPDPDRS